ncbi:NAD/NADP octopine/nopaline dehydrogenase family protein [Salicibibacter cibarius]|uniref:NAD/NADP octopine/nopaline dehydrogenase family protein n=1 Tax=Salicibibacter cibarius TaxID=2743000 RepID=A0A7T6YZV6_9BACI|nr:NAD/NADP octopine/nopaline dehydrogenase family protein [Salicibibacter cibarius]QQK74386.1 NAD/NADP octopine/nopaline dehydrogenase family protein [Salicibibacter cibarius]
MEIAVLGGGNGSYAAAVDLTEKGHEVRFWRRNQDLFKDVLNNQSIQVKDANSVRTISLSLATDDLEKAIRGAKLIVIPLPAFAQPSLVKELAPLLEDNQVVFLPPGTFGSYLMSRSLSEEGCRASVIFAETGTLPYLARKHDEKTVSISGRATRLPTGIFPSEQSGYAFEVLNEAYPAVETLQDALDGALMNAGPIIHPPLILMNAGPIEHFDKWDIHDEGTQQSIRNVHKSLDKERIKLREALGYNSPHFPLDDHYNPGGDEWMYGDGAHTELVDGEDWYESLDLRTHRYMKEDISCGLAFLVSLGDWLNIQLPTASGLLAIASSIIREDLRKTGRTMENMKLSNVSRKQLTQTLKKGTSFHEVK